MISDRFDMGIGVVNIMKKSIRVTFILAAVTVVSVYLAACGATTGGNTYEQQTRSTQSYATTTQSAAKTSTKATTKAATQSAAKATTKAAAKSATKSSVKATTKSSSSKKSKYNSYDDGYNAIYDDDDYDWERYKKDNPIRGRKLCSVASSASIFLI